MRERTQEIYAELRGLNLPAEAWALIAELNNLNLMHPDHISAETKRARDKERLARKRQESRESRDIPYIKDNNPGGVRGVGKGEGRATPKAILQTVLDEKRASEVVEHRKKLRKPMTNYAAQRLAEELKKAPDPNAAADLMILKGWQGFEVGWLKNGKDPPGKVVSFRASPPKRTYREIKAEQQ